MKSIVKRSNRMGITLKDNLYFENEAAEDSGAKL